MKGLIINKLCGKVALVRENYLNKKIQCAVYRIFLRFKALIQIILHQINFKKRYKMFIFG